MRIEKEGILARFTLSEVEEFEKHRFTRSCHFEEREKSVRSMLDICAVII
jgi:hypothetical protein